MAPMMGIQGIGFRLQRIGNIKIGKKGPEQKTSGGKKYRRPIKFEYFVVTTMERDKNEDWITDDVAMKELGEKPTEIPVFVPYDRIDLIVPHELAYWSASKRHCHGNRVIAEETDEKTGEIVQRTCPCDKLNKECKPHVILNVMLELGGRVGGVHQLRTGSWNSLENIVASLNLIKTITGGPIAGLPLTMTIRPQQALVEGRKTTIYVVGLEFRANPQLEASPVKQMQEIARGIVQNRLATGQDMLAIEENAASLNRDLDEDGLDWSEEFASTGDQRIDEKTRSKTADLKEKLAGTKEEKPSTAESESEKSEPTEVELKNQLLEEIKLLRDNEALPQVEKDKVTKWLEKDHSLNILQKNRDKLLDFIKSYEDEEPEDEPSLGSLTGKLIDLMGNARENKLVTEEEYVKIFEAADKNQTTKWLTEIYDNWSAIIEDRGKVRAAEFDEAKGETGKQGSFA